MSLSYYTEKEDQPVSQTILYYKSIITKKFIIGKCNDMNYYCYKLSSKTRPIRRNNPISED